jgi:hypothetical protein
LLLYSADEELRELPPGLPQHNNFDLSKGHTEKHIGEEDWGKLELSPRGELVELVLPEAEQQQEGKAGQLAVSIPEPA